MAESATPDAVVVLGTDVTGFSSAIDKANQTLRAWGDGVVASVASVGERMMSVWAKVGENLANPIGMLSLPFQAIGAAADGLMTVVTAPLKVIPLIGGAAADAIRGIYAAGAAAVSAVPAAVAGILSLIERGADVVQKVADELGRLSEMSAAELSSTLGGWAGSIAEWVAGRAFSADTASRIGRFFTEELGGLFADLFRDEDLDFVAVNASLAEASERAGTLSGIVRSIGNSIWATRADFRGTWDVILRDGQATVRELAFYFRDLKPGEMIAEGLEAAFDRVGEYTETAFDQVELFFARTLTNIAEMLDRALNRFREPIAGLLDFVQALLERLGLITKGLGGWGQEVRDAASVGQLLVEKMIGGAAYIANVLGKVVGQVALILAKLIDTMSVLWERNLIDSGWDLIKMNKLWMGHVASAFGATETGEAMKDSARAAADRLEGDGNRRFLGEKSGTQEVTDAIRQFGERMAKMGSPEAAMQAAIEALRKRQAEAEDVRRQRNEEALRRQLDMAIQAIPALMSPAFFGNSTERTASEALSRATSAIIANSREASNLIAKAQGTGEDPARRAMREAAEQRKLQLEQQKKAAVLLESIDRRLDRMQVIGTV